MNLYFPFWLIWSFGIYILVFILIFLLALFSPGGFHHKNRTLGCFVIGLLWPLIVTVFIIAIPIRIMTCIIGR